MTWDTTLSFHIHSSKSELANQSLSEMRGKIFALALKFRKSIQKKEEEAHSFEVERADLLF